MRDLKACQAEVFRRSKQRIWARKQRTKRLLMACIPLALCLSAVVVIAMQPEERSGEIAENQYSTQYAETAAAAGGAVAYEGAAVTVSGNSIRYCYTSAEKVDLISGIIHSIVNTDEDTRGSAFVEDRVDETAGQKQNYQGKGYEILIRHEDGSQSRYLLVGSALVDPATEESFPMGEETLATLKEALGISCD